MSTSSNIIYLGIPKPLDNRTIIRLG